jgi:DsbC/DsbD-like thiol-disulfide interchange protein
MKKTYHAIAGLALLLSSTAAIHGQRPSEIVKWNASVTKSTGASTSVALSATIQDGWHVYALSQPVGGPTPLKISIPAGTPFSLQAPVVEGKVTRHDDPNFKMETLYYLNSANFTVAVKKEAGASSETVPVDVRFQACSDRLCLPPYTAHLTADLKRK